MALPVVLIHGYSSEGKTADTASYNAQSIGKIYGRLVDDLRTMDANIVPVNVSRYVSLDDGVGIDDLSLSFDRVLKAEHPDLLKSGFNVIVHSTGALVARNWIRRHAVPGACPLQRLIHLAGANLGSGWAHIGSSQMVKFARLVQGVQRGLAVLGALELASDWTIDLHTHFLQPGRDMFGDYGVMEYCLVGSQTPPEYLVVPVRYGKEDGSDGVVRVSSCNLNFNYSRIGPTLSAADIDWDAAAQYARLAVGGSLTSKPSEKAFQDGYYEVKLDSRPGLAPTGPDCDPAVKPRAQIPFAIPYRTSHSDAKSETAIVSGSQNREDVLPLIASALNAAPADYASQIAVFDALTAATYDRVRTPQHASGLLAGIVRAVRDVMDNPRGQYDRHSQLVFRVCDHLGEPVNDFSIYFNSFGGDGRPNQLINRLFQDKHKNARTPNTINFYLRTECWDDDAQDWRSQLDGVHGVSLEIDAIDPATQRVLYLPLRMRITADELRQWIQPHRTTIVDIRLMRLPNKVTFVLKTA